MQLVKQVLDDAYNEIDDPSTRDACIKAELTGLGKEYEGLRDLSKPPIDYSGDIKRFAYLYKYTVAHSDYVMQVVNRSKSIKDLLSRPGVLTRVACLGGGPGSDFLGMLKWMLNNNIEQARLHCELYDKEPAWANTWSDVVPTLGDVPFDFSTAFMPMDVTVPATWEHFRKLDKADLFTLSYFISEVWKVRTQAEAFFTFCFTRMKKGSTVLFIDNDATSFTDWFDALAARNNLKVLMANSEEMAFSNDEQKADLGEYFTKFGWPKRAAKVVYRVLAKE